MATYPFTGEEPWDGDLKGYIDAGDAASVQSTIIDAKGDLIVGTAADTITKKPAGTNGSFPVADSTQTDGIRYTSALFFEGAGDPEGVVTAPVGSSYADTTNGWIYIKNTGAGNTGWVVQGQPVPRTAFASGTYTFPLSGSGSALQTNNQLRLTPWFCPQTYSVARIGAEITTVGEAGSKLRLGIYNDNGAGVPGTLVVDAGQIAGDSATVQEITLGGASVLSRGWYWLGAAAQSGATTAPTARTVATANLPIGFLVGAGTSLPGAGSTPQGYFQNSVSGALPSPFVSGGFTNNIPRLFVKLS